MVTHSSQSDAAGEPELPTGEIVLQAPPDRTSLDRKSVV